MRKLPALLAATALVASLAACTASSTPAAIDGCVPVADPGRSSDAVTATGLFGSSPDVSFPTPLISGSLQRTVVSAGEGEQVRAGDQVHFHVTVLNGRTGEEIAATGYTDESFTRGSAGQTANFGVGLACAQVGERFVLTGPAGDVAGAEAAESAGLAADDPLVLVYDVMASYLGKADGVNQLPRDGMPNVATAVDGTPGVSFIGEAPDELRATVIKRGSGHEAKTGDRVVVHFSIWSWPTNGNPSRQLNTTWNTGIASIFTIDEESMPESFRTALTGTPVGSQVLVSTPADAELDTDARVLVVDLLGIMG